MKIIFIHALLSFVAARRPHFFHYTTESSQLAYFVAKIATEYFPPDKILLVSSTEHDDTVDVMLQHVHQHAQWHLHVSRPGALRLRQIKQHDDKVGSYVIFTTGADDVVSQAEGLARSRTWNHRAPFLVVVGKSPGSPEQLALSTFEELWANVRVCNVVVLVEHDTVFRLYSWSPYVQHKQCDEVQEVELIDVLSEADTRNFTSKTRLFSYHVPDNFWGCPITVSLMYRDSTVEKLISNFLRRLNFTVSYKLTANESLAYTTLLRRVLSDFVLGTSDVATTVALQIDIMKLEDPTQALEVYENAWHVPCAKPMDRIQKIARIFSTSLWVILTALLISISFIMWLLARLSLEDNAYRDISTVLYNAWAVAVGVAVTKMPCSYHLRIVIFAWITYCLSISTLFQIFLTSFLVDPGLHEQITNLHELQQSKIEYGVVAELRRMYSEQDALTKVIDKGHQCYDFTECVERIIGTGKFALFENSKKVQKYLASVKKRKRVCVMNNIDVDSGQMVALFSRRTLILEKFNKFVTHMFESGEITKLETELWTVHSYTDDEEAASEEYFVFTISHLLVAFYVHIIGHSVGVVIFLLELLHHFYSTHRQRSFPRNIIQRLS